MPLELRNSHLHVFGAISRGRGGAFVEARISLSGWGFFLFVACARGVALRGRAHPVNTSQDIVTTSGHDLVQCYESTHATALAIGCK